MPSPLLYQTISGRWWNRIRGQADLQKGRIIVYFIHLPALWIQSQVLQLPVIY